MQNEKDPDLFKCPDANQLIKELGHIEFERLDVLQTVLDKINELHGCDVEQGGQQMMGFVWNGNSQFIKLRCRYDCPVQHWFSYESKEGLLARKVKLYRSINFNHSLKAHQSKLASKAFLF